MGIFFRTKWMLYNNVEYKRLWLEQNNQLSDIRRKFIYVQQFVTHGSYVSGPMLAGQPQFLLLQYETFDAMQGGPKPAVPSCLLYIDLHHLQVPLDGIFIVESLTTLDYNSPYRAK